MNERATPLNLSPKEEGEEEPTAWWCPFSRSDSCHFIPFFNLLYCFIVLSFLNCCCYLSNFRIIYNKPTHVTVQYGTVHDEWVEVGEPVELFLLQDSTWKELTSWVDIDNMNELTDLRLWEMAKLSFNALRKWVSRWLKHYFIIQLIIWQGAEGGLVFVLFSLALALMHNCTCRTSPSRNNVYSVYSCFAACDSLFYKLPIALGELTGGNDKRNWGIYFLNF